MRKLIMFGLLIQSLSGLAGEPYYTWIDDSGVRHYAQMKPRNTKAVLVNEERNFGYRTEQSKQENKLLNPAKTEQVKKDADQLEKDAKKTQQVIEQTNRDMAKAKASWCEKGKQNLQALLLKNRIRLKQPDGTYRYARHEEKQALVSKNQEIIDNNC